MKEAVQAKVYFRFCHKMSKLTFLFQIFDLFIFLHIIFLTVSNQIQSHRAGRNYSKAEKCPVVYCVSKWLNSAT